MPCQRFDIVSNGPQNVAISDNTTVKSNATEQCDAYDYTPVVDSKDGPACNFSPTAMGNLTHAAKQKRTLQKHGPETDR